MDITMLGTGNALVTECYNTCFVLHEDNQYFMIDGGGGNTILHQLKHAGIDWKNIRNIFVTHKHIDHITGILWMIRMICQYMNQEEYEGEATIYAHDEVIDLLRDLSEKLLQKKETDFIDKRLHLISIEDGETKEILKKKVIQEEKLNAEVQKTIAEAENTIRTQGTLYNREFEGKTIVLYLLKKYGVNVPIKTQGWVNNALAKVWFRDGKITYSYYKTSKDSTVFYGYLKELEEKILQSA